MTEKELRLKNCLINYMLVKKPLGINGDGIRDEVNIVCGHSFQIEKYTDYIGWMTFRTPFKGYSYFEITFSLSNNYKKLVGIHYEYGYKGDQTRGGVSRLLDHIKKRYLACSDEYVDIFLNKFEILNLESL